MVIPYKNTVDFIMFFTMIRLYENGIARTKEQLRSDKKYTGDLIISDWIDQNVKISRRSAELKSYCGASRISVLPPIFDAAVDRITSEKILISGCDIDLAEGVSTRHHQVWLLRLATAEEAQKKPNDSV